MTILLEGQGLYFENASQECKCGNGYGQTMNDLWYFRSAPLYIWNEPKKSHIMKTKMSQILFLAITCCLLNFASPITAGTPKAPAKKASCVGVQPFFYGFTYFPGQMVTWNGSLYMATSQNQYQYPFMGQYWAWFGPCN